MAKVIQTADLTPESIAQMSWLEKENIYNGLDCCVTLEVLNALLPQLDNVSASTYSFSRQLQGPVLEMSTRGLLVDQRRRRQVLSKFREETSILERNLSRLVKEGIGCELANWKSNEQLKSLFYDVLGLKPERKRNANGQLVPTVDRDAIEKLSGYFFAEPVCNHILALRDIEKKIEFLETGIDRDGRIRCNFNIAGTNSGRLASSMSEFGTGRNLQNVDRDLRSTIISDRGMKFANLDLEQGDARNVGAICWNSFVDSHGDRFAGSYLDACESGDLHTSVCKMAWTQLDWRANDAAHNKRVAEVLAYRQDSYRQLAKKLGHGTNYYGLPRTMAKHTKVDTPVIEDFQRAYFHAFPVIGTYDKRDHKSDNWHNHVRQQLQDTHQITTLLGRRRYFFGHPKDDETLRSAIAYEPQSLTADEIDTGLLRLFLANRVQLMLQVHDSILIQYPEDQEDEIVPWALDQLRVNITLAKGREFVVPTEAKTGWNWGDASAVNPDGLVKWRSHDQRRRLESPSSLSLDENLSLG